MHARYLYCIIESRKNEEFGEIGIGGSKVYAVTYKDLGAVVSNSPGVDPIDVLSEGITHQKVVEEVMKNFAIIPMSFGQVPKSEEDVKGFLAEHYDELKELFVTVEGKVELGLKASWKMDKIMKEIVNSNDRIRILQKQINSLPEEKSYYLKIELGKLVADELKTHGEALAEKIFDSLKPVAVEAKMNKPLNDRMILNSAFLVARDKEGHFDEIVNEIEKKYPELTLKYVVSAPYNFVTIGA
ncbi:MAG: GvpL/GvpF family gas vesicle protein [Nanoarchaeota archaeon]